ncbi:MAG: sulfite exporter TauE/SafE family protein [Cyclobacteriaceae bacterium]
MEIAGYIGSVFIGVVLGLLGGGGSILAIPILVYLFHLDPVIATAYSLFIVGTTSFFGVFSKQRQDLVDFRTGIIFGLPSLIAIFATRKWLVHALPDIIVNTESIVITKRFFLLGLFAILMIVTSFSMIFGRRKVEAEQKNSSSFLLVAVGTLIGLLTGLVGAGGGFLIIPTLVLFAGLPMKTATGTSLFIIAVNSVIGFTGDILNLTIDWVFLLSLTGLAMVGAFCGNWLSGKIRNKHLRIAFGWFTLVIGTMILFRELFLA